MCAGVIYCSGHSQASVSSENFLISFFGGNFLPSALFFLNSYLDIGSSVLIFNLPLLLLSFSSLSLFGFLEDFLNFIFQPFNYYLRLTYNFSFLFVSFIL